MPIRSDYRATRLRARLLCVLGCIALPLQAAEIDVTSPAGGRGGPDCTLRDAITAANTDAVSGGCNAGSGADTIHLPAGSNINLSERETQGIELGDIVGIPVLSTDITIEGHGSVLQRAPSAPSCTPAVAGPDTDFRLIIVRPPAVPLGQLGSSNTVTLRDLSLTWGCADNADGGAILNEGAHLLLDQVTLQQSGARWRPSRR